MHPRLDLLQHGYSTEQDFIYVTTQNLSIVSFTPLAMKQGQPTLLVLCAAFRAQRPLAQPVGEEDTETVLKRSSGATTTTPCR